MARRPFLPLFVAAIAAVTLVACGSEDDSAVPTAPTEASGAPAAQGVVQVSPAEGSALIASKGAALTIIDVRTPEEYAAGHIEGAVNMDVEGGRFSALIADLPTDAEYIVYCRSGRRSALAAQAMQQAGFATIYDLGGLVDWQAAGLPIVTG